MCLIGSYTLNPILPDPLVILEAFIFMVPVFDSSESTSKLQSDKNSMYTSCVKVLLVNCDPPWSIRKEDRVMTEKKKLFSMDLIYLGSSCDLNYKLIGGGVGFNC